MPIEEPYNETASQEADVIEMLGGRPISHKEDVIKPSETKEKEYCAQCEIMGICPRHDKSLDRGRK